MPSWLARKYAKKKMTSLPERAPRKWEKKSYEGNGEE